MIRREEGTTLVELLAAVVLGSILVGSLVSLIVVGFQSYESAKRSLADTTAITEVRASLTDDVRSAAASLSAVSLDGLTLTLVVLDQSQNAGRRTIVYQYVPCPPDPTSCLNGTLTRTVTIGTNAPLGTQTVARTLAKSYGSAVFALSSGTVTANLPLPTNPVQTVELKAAMRVQAP